MAADILNLVEVRSFVGTDPKDDAAIKLKINSVCSLWDRLTNRKWARDTITKIFEPEQRTIYFWSPLAPIETISLVEWDKTQTEDDAVAVDEADYSVNVETGEVRRLRDEFWLPFVKATVLGGYTVTTLPADVKEALMLQIKFSMARNSSDKLIWKSISGAKSTASLIDSEYHPEFKALSRRLRRK